MITTTEEECFLRFIFLLLRGGTEVLRCIAEKALQRNNLTLDQLLTVNRSSIQNTKKLNPIQKDLLYPASPKTPDLEDFDITLLSYLINTFLIGSLDSSEIEAVEKIREWRNEYNAHATAPKMPLNVFVRERNRLEKIILLVSQDLPEEKKNKMLDIIGNAEKEQVDLTIVLKEIKELDRSNDFSEVIERQKEVIERQKETLDQINKLFSALSEIKMLLEGMRVIKDDKTMSEIKMLLEGMRVIKDDKTARGKVQVNAEDSDTVRNAEDLLLKASEDRIEDSTSEEVIEVKKKVDKLKDDLKERDVKVASISEGSVIFEFQCFSLTAFLKLVDYFNSHEFQARLGEIGNALEHVVGKTITVSGTLDKSFQDVIQIIQQNENERKTQFEMACIGIGGILRAFEIFEEGYTPEPLSEQTSSLTGSVGKQMTLKASIDVCRMQEAVESIKELLNMNLTEDSGTSMLRSHTADAKEPFDKTGGEYTDNITETGNAEDSNTRVDIVASARTSDANVFGEINTEANSQKPIASDMKTSKEDSHKTLTQVSEKRSEQYAVGKRKFDALELGSDEFPEYQCSRCTEAGKYIDAVQFCMMCDENFCQSCLDDHNRFPVMRSHQMSDFLSCETGHVKQNMPVQGCKEHVGKLINVFCPLHDFVGCAMCVAVGHRSCQGKQYICDISSGIQANKEISEMESDAKDVFDRLEQQKHQKQDHLKQLQPEKEIMSKTLDNLLIKINDKLGKMKTAISCEIDTKINTKEKMVKDTIEEIDRMKSSVENIPKTLQDANTISKAELFVQLKIGKSILQEHKTKMEELSRVVDDTGKLTLVPSNDIRKFITSDDVEFGHIAENIVVQSIKHFADFNLKLNSDIASCYFHDACVTLRGEVIAVDYNNKRIKKLDHSYAVTEHLDVSNDYPEYICEVDSTEVVVTLHYSKKIQFISHHPLRFGKCFTAHAVCRGMDCYNKQLYICCGGYTQDKEGPPHIAVYSLEGILLRSFYEGLKLPLYIKVSDVSFISEFGQKQIRKADSLDFLLKEIKFSSIDIPKGSCRIGDDQLCVAGYISNNLVLISNNGNDEREILSEEDGIAKPLAVCFNKERSHLIVLFGNDVIKVFKVNI